MTRSRSIQDERPIERRSPPIATATVLAVTSVVTGSNVFVPEIAHVLRRNPTKLAAGEWWRLITPLFVQTDRWWQIVTVFCGIAVVGVAFERRFGSWRWLLFYLGCGIVGELAGYAWQPHGSGASVGGAGLLGGLLVWLVVCGNGLPWRVRLWGPIGLFGAIVLAFFHDIHGPPVLVGACLATVLWWRSTARSARR